VLQIAVATTVLGAVALGYWLGIGTAELDRQYLRSLERISAAQETMVAQLNRDLIDARLAQSVDQQAAQSLRSVVSELRSEVTGLEEEVVFYKSLMAPSSLTKGLQIADFQVLGEEQGGEFAFQLLLTQAQVRRDWVQGSVALTVLGSLQDADGGEQRVLSFADLDTQATYPLKFKFRYFQNLTGRIRLPDGFRPHEVQVTVTRSGGAEALERSFPWPALAG
jgi:hypothetical protein